MCIYCEYTDAEFQIDTIPVTSNLFTITVEEQIYTVFEVPNWPPKFSEDLPQNVTFIRDSSWMQVFNYELPRAFDLEGDQFETKVTGLDSSFISFDDGVFELRVRKQSGNFTAYIELVDEQGNSQVYSLLFIIVPFETPVEIFVPEIVPEVVTEPIDLPVLSVRLR